MLTVLTELIIGLIALFIIIDMFTGFSFFKNILNRFKKKHGEIAESVRDPEADALVALENIKREKEQISILRTEILLSKKKAQNKLQKLKNDVSKYEQLAKLAGAAKNSEDVRTALTKKKAALEKQETVEKEINSLTTQEDSIESKLEEFDALIEKAETNKDYLTTELKINTFNEKVATVLQGGGTAMSALERLEADVEHSKAKAELAGELADDSKSLENKYKPKNMVSDEDVNKYLQ